MQYLLTACTHAPDAATCFRRAAPLVIVKPSDLRPCQHDFETQFLAEYVAKTHNLQDFCKCSSVDVFGTKARMDTYRIYSLV